MQVLEKNSVKRLELRALEKLIAERERYHREQEALIRDLVESGNIQLMALNHDILLAKQELRNIRVDIRTAAQDKVMLNQDLELIREDIRVTVIQTTYAGISPAFG